MSSDLMLTAHAELVEEYLKNHFDGITDTPAVLKEAMEYSLFAGGKRIRPALCLEFYKALGGDPKKVVNFAAAIEMIHTYSLIHDDLPCMDDDDMRRGRPSCHKKFGEDIALLAGDALLTQSFYAAADADDTIPADRVRDSIKALSFAAGMCNMVGGQVLDLQSEGKKITVTELEKLQDGKTVAMLKVPAQIACIVSGATKEQYDAACLYCENIGRAFQIRDDILDVIGDEQTFGKPVGSDADNDKNTYVTFYGLERSQQLVEELTNGAVSALDAFDNSDNLKGLALDLARRNK